MNKPQQVSFFPVESVKKSIDTIAFNRISCIRNIAYDHNDDRDVFFLSSLFHAYRTNREKNMIDNCMEDIDSNAGLEDEKTTRSNNL